MLSGLVVEPDTLMIGSGTQTVNFSVRVDDPDGDLRNVKVKQIIVGQKNPTLAVLVDDGSNGDAAAGDGRFTANVDFSTGMANSIRLKIRAKDTAREKANLKATLTVVEKSTSIWVSNGPEGGSINLLVIDPMTPTTVYAGTFGGGVFKSTDGGDSWSVRNTGLTNTDVSALVIDPMTPTTVYVGTGGDGVFKSTDEGATWKASNTGLTNTWIISLAIDRATPTIVYAGTNGGGVFRRDFAP